MMFERAKPAEFRQQVRRSFDATGTHYGTRGDYHWQFAKRLVDHTPLQSGQTVVDVATGTAPAAIVAAQRSGSRFDLQLTPEHLAQIKAQYIKQFRHLARNHESWNRDYEQYVVAYKP